MGYNDYISEKNIFADKIIKWIADILAVALIAFFLCIYLGDRVEVIGSSMSPQLTSKQLVLVDKISYELGEPKRFDVIVYKNKGDNSQYYIKRIIGLPGEGVTITDNTIYITKQDGTTFELNDIYSNTDKFENGQAAEMVVIGNNEYFVLGDNRNLSEDSRFSYVGNISGDDILGRAWLIASPFSKIGFVK